MSCHLIIELWDGIKPFINKKERLVAADTLISLFDEYGYAEGIDEEHGLDSVLAAAVASRFGVIDEELDDESDWG